MGYNKALRSHERLRDRLLPEFESECFDDSKPDGRRRRAPAPTRSPSSNTPTDNLVRVLNHRLQHRDYTVPIGLLITLALLIVAAKWPIAGAAGLLVILFLIWHHWRSRSLALNFEIQDEVNERLRTFREAIRALRSAEAVWLVGDAAAPTRLPLHPPMLHRTRLTLEPIQLPNPIRANVTPLALRIAEGVLYFFPDRLLFWTAGRFASIPYEDLKLSYRAIAFLEREQEPSDGSLESRMPRVLAGASTIPSFFYGMIHLDAAPFFEARLMTSRPQSAQEFVASLRRLTNAESTSDPERDSKQIRYTHFELNRAPLFYHLRDAELKQLRSARDAFALISACECVWRYDEEKSTGDRKRNAGAATLVKRTRVYPKLEDQIPGYESNAVTGLCVDDTTLYVLPDGFVVRAGKRLEYIRTPLSADAWSCSFREEELTPRDAEVIGKTWRFANKRAGPDLRFKDNREITIYRYGQIEMTLGTWSLRLCLSRTNAAEQAAAALRNLQGSNAARDGTGKAADVSDALRALGLEAGATWDEASAAYRTLAAQNHPDKVARMAPDFLDLAERKMRRLNEAYEQIRACHSR